MFIGGASGKGTEVLYATAFAITESVERIKYYTVKVQSRAYEYQDTPDPIMASLFKVMSDIAEIVKRASDSANSMAETLKETAKVCEEILTLT